MRRVLRDPTVADAWGKLPSIMLNKHTFELGGFSECLHIERNGSAYPTKYCMAHTYVDIINISNEYPRYASNILISEKHKDLNLILTLGLCLPSACSLKYLEPIMNELINGTVSKVTLNLLPQTCQSKESDFELNALDKVAA